MLSGLSGDRLRDTSSARPIFRNHRMKKIHLKYEEDYTLEMCYQRIVLDKLFGALIFCALRIHADANTCEWVIEREVIDKEGDVSWEEVSRIDGQDSIYFHDME